MEASTWGLGGSDQIKIASTSYQVEQCQFLRVETNQTNELDFLKADDLIYAESNKLQTD